MSSSLPRTPVKAIPSTLLTRTTPITPPPNATYEPVVKSVLRFRLIYKVFLYSALVSWILTSLWVAWGLGGPTGQGFAGTILVPFRPFTILVAVVGWSSTALPAAVLRKVYLTPTRTSATSLSALVKSSLATTATRRSFLVYSLSAVTVALLHASCASNSDYIKHDLSFFVKSRKHPYYLNGRLLFLLISQLVAAVAFSTRNITLDRFVFGWEQTSARSSNNQDRFRYGDIVQAMLIAGILSTLTLPIASVVFGLARMSLPLIFRLPFIPSILRPFTAHFLRGSWTIFLPFFHVSLMLKTWSIAFTTLMIWEFSNSIFDTVIFQPVIASNLTPEPHISLVSGIFSSDIGFRFWAYSELNTLASDNSTTSAQRRSSLFNDQNHYNNLWSHLLRESLILLGNDYRLFLRRGKTPLPTPLPPPPVQNQTSVGTPTQLIRTSVFQSSKHISPVQAVVESLGSDGVLAQALDAGAEAARIPELFRSVETAVLPVPAKEEVKKAVEQAASLPDNISKQIKEKARSALLSVAPPRLTHCITRLDVWWNGERLRKTVQSYLPHAELDVAIVEVLSHLICASLTEDKYGVVQRDIPKTLEAMLSFLSAIESYHAEVQAKYQPPSQDQTYTVEQLEELEAIRAEIDAATDTLNYVSNGLKTSIARVTRAFGDKLLAFKFPPRIANKLQPFLEYW